MKWYQTSVALAATMYIFANTASEGEILAAGQSSLILDVSQKSRFIYWIGDNAAQSKVHFCSDMTVTGSTDGAIFTECENPTGRFPSAIDDTARGSKDRPRDIGARRFSADVILATEAFVRVRSEASAEKAFLKASLGSRSVSTDDNCWLHQAATETCSFRLSPRTQIRSVGHPVEIVPEDDQAAMVVDGVIAKIIAQAKRNPALMKQLRGHAAEMRKRGSQNHGWMSETMMIEAHLRTWAAVHYRRYKAEQWIRPPAAYPCSNA
ncbi:MULTISPECIES: hypothetical protein [Rhizobium]|uniref:hypothetical protein n=1 Tax=Rhizobium TaxID=379 RepID=UPI001C90521C|nr:MULTISPECIES: hypothetical protein [Rhizobium]MBY3195074.1 hypothetical protein [Rhizobium laguerreae]MBY5603902.1 hypothetical protein [Rhizobium leguminosarum]